MLIARKWWYVLLLAVIALARAYGCGLGTRAAVSIVGVILVRLMRRLTPMWPKKPTTQRPDTYPDDELPAAFRIDKQA